MSVNTLQPLIITNSSVILNSIGSTPDNTWQLEYNVATKTIYSKMINKNTNVIINSTTIGPEDNVNPSSRYVDPVTGKIILLDIYNRDKKAFLTITNPMTGSIKKILINDVSNLPQASILSENDPYIKVAGSITIGSKDATGIQTNLTFNPTTGDTRKEIFDPKTGIKTNIPIDPTLTEISQTLTNSTSGETTQLIVNLKTKRAILITRNSKTGEITTSSIQSTLKSEEQSQEEVSQEEVSQEEVSQEEVSQEEKKLHIDPETFTKCNVDINTIQTKINFIQEKLSSAKSANDYLTILSSADFYNNVKNIADIFNKYSYDTIKCISDNDPSKKFNVCNTVIQGDDLAKQILDKGVLDLFEKYEPIFKNIIKKINTIIDESYESCNLNYGTPGIMGDSEYAKFKLRKLYSKIALLFVDKSELYMRIRTSLFEDQNDPYNALITEACKYVCPKPPDNSNFIIKNTTFYIVLSVVIVVFLILCGYSTYSIFWKNNIDSY